LGVDIPSGLKRSDSDRLDNLERFAKATQIFIAQGVLTPDEVRQCFAGDNVSFNINLQQNPSSFNGDKSGNDEGLSDDEWDAIAVIGDAEIDEALKSVEQSASLPS
jgi:hypothetical protein